jgi:carbamate kinase
VATLLGQVLVHPDDPAFARPTKPIGPFYTAAQAEKLRATKGWELHAEPSGFRRVVGSPEPAEILELPVIRELVKSGVVTISAGGGGVPVARTTDGKLAGIEGVVDKDLTAALLARDLSADALLLLTDVEAVHERWPDPHSRAIRTGSPAALRALPLAPGSMGPKVEAACRFGEAKGGIAAIGALEQATALLAGKAGTRVTTASELVFWDNDA